MIALISLEKKTVIKFQSRNRTYYHQSTDLQCLTSLESGPNDNFDSTADQIAIISSQLMYDKVYAPFTIPLNYISKSAQQATPTQIRSGRIKKWPPCIVCCYTRRRKLYHQKWYFVLRGLKRDVQQANHRHVPTQSLRSRDTYSSLYLVFHPHPR